MRISVSHRGDNGVLAVAVAGDIDITANTAVETAISDAVTTAGVTGVEVDLTEVEFLDSSGITLLLKGRRLADAHRVTYRVTGASGFARQVLEMTGVWEHLTGDPGHAEPATP